MRALIDNSYLHSVARCLEGQALDESDLNNFFRFMGEIISHREILITAQKEDEVYAQTIQKIEILEDLGKTKGIIEYIPPSDLNHKSAINRAASRVKLMNMPTLTSFDKGADISPKFSNTNPDIEFHSWLKGEGTDISSNDLEKYGNRYIPILLIKLAGRWEELNRHVLESEDWDQSDSLALASKMRSWVYSEIGEAIYSTYIPSISRGININLSFSEPSMRNLVLTDQTQYGDFSELVETNNEILTGLLLRNNSNPIDSIIDALHIRKKVKPLRDLLYKRPLLKKGDALLLYRYQRIQELIKIKEDYLELGRPVFPFSAFNPVFSSSSMNQEVEASLPIISGVVKSIEHYKKKSLLSKMKPLLLPMLQAKLADNSPAEQFRKNAGLYE
jgi:hypothetical protein